MKRKLKQALVGAALVASVTAVIGLGAGEVLASQPKTTICHPVASATGGSTHAGYSIITTANPSSHIDEETGEPKHEHDGRVDFVVDEAHPCPPSDPSPSPTPSPDPSPSPSPDPDPSPTPDPDPSPTPDPSPSEEPSPEPDPEPSEAPNPGPRTADPLPVTGISGGYIAAALTLAALGLGTLWLSRTKEDDEG